MNNLNEEIRRQRELILLKEYPKVVDTYDHVEFLDGVVGKSKPSKDAINPALLKDINTAAGNAGVKVAVTTAITGHVHLPSRHPDGNAVDIAIINGKAVRKSNRADADKFVSALVKMGYKKNKEIGNDKAVLTFGFPDHDDHVHVSNKTSSSWDGKVFDDSDDEPETNKTSDDNDFLNFLFGGLKKYKGKNQGEYFEKFLEKVIKMIFPNIKEQLDPESLGKEVVIHSKDVIIPSRYNDSIYCPVNGVISRPKGNPGDCTNQITVRFTLGKEYYYLEYCGMKTIRVSIGDNVRTGTILGFTDNNVTVYFYNQAGQKIRTNSLNTSPTSSVIGPEEEGKPNYFNYGTPSKKIKINPFSDDKERSIKPVDYRDTEKNVGKLRFTSDEKEIKRQNPFK